MGISLFDCGSFVYCKIGRGSFLRAANQPPIYLMLNKPRGCVTTRHDPEGRPTVMDSLKRIRSRVYPVGRLDYNSEGLLLFTNDGDFAERVLSAKSEIPKTYHVKVNGHPTEGDLQKLRDGVKLDARPTAPAIRWPGTTSSAGSTMAMPPTRSTLCFYSPAPPRDARR